MNWTGCQYKVKCVKNGDTLDFLMQKCLSNGNCLEEPHIAANMHRIRNTIVYYNTMTIS